MTTKVKTFDCVKMKHDIQKQLHEEYESRKAEFASYVDFLQAKADQSLWVREMREKFGCRKQ